LNVNLQIPEPYIIDSIIDRECSASIPIGSTRQVQYDTKFKTTDSVAWPDERRVDALYGIKFHIQSLKKPAHRSLVAMFFNTIELRTKQKLVEEI